MIALIYLPDEMRRAIFPNSTKTQLFPRRYQGTIDICLGRFMENMAVLQQISNLLCHFSDIFCSKYRMRIEMENGFFP